MTDTISSEAVSSEPVSTEPVSSGALRTGFSDRRGVRHPFGDRDAETQVRSDDRSHVFHSWSAQAQIDPLPIAAGEGSTFWDYQGNAYLDFSSQLVNLNLGHQHPDLVAAIQQQAGRLATVQPSMANDVRGELARLIARVAPGTLNRVFFTNGGADANEYAVRMARRVTGRRKVLSMYRSYHGGTGAATVAAIIIETVVGTNGVLVPPPGYLAGVRELCDRYGIVYIADEVMVGFGRIGEWFAVDAFDVVPDLITFAKGVNSGYVPLGGVVISDRIAGFFDDVPFAGGLTYSGHPLACAAGVATFDVFVRDGILERVRDLGARVVEPTVTGWLDTHPSLGEVRGRGLFWALELVLDRETREPLVPFNATGADAAPMGEVAAACKAAGVWPFTHFNRMHIAPPLIIDEEELRRGLAAIDAALTVADRFAR